MEINSYVIIKKDAQNLSGYAHQALIGQYPLKIYAKQDGFLYCKTENLAPNKFQPNCFGVLPKNVTELTEKEYIYLTKQLNKNYIKEIKEIVKKIKTKKIALNLRKDYELKNKPILQTTTNFVKVYDPNSYSNASKGTSYWMVGCCSLARQNRDFVVYIPKSWLNYYGYNLTDLKMWLKFIENCEINFDVKILGITDLFNEFSDKAARTKQYENLSQPTNNFYLKENEQAYKLLLSDTGYAGINYLHFILIRYIYSSKYWTIPFTAMKLKNNMPELSNWECLLLAHNVNNNDGYYSLASTSFNTNLIVTKNFNKSKDILAALKNNSTMNNSFKLIYTDGSIKNYIIEEKYDELQKKLNTIKTNN